jgi:hypothetical protein
MPVEDTDLERRVLAHELILQALMAELALRLPGVLDGMHAQFSVSRRGMGEHDYIETADYADAFLRQVARLATGQPRQSAIPAAVDHAVRSSPPDVNRASPSSVKIRTVRRGNVWQVTCDDVFYGDYLASAPAAQAAQQAARQIESKGGQAEVI